jgi:D-tyrosyl-tRNA(Tyr) deacylase
MRIVLQRVTRAAVTVGDDTIGEIGQGLLLLVGMAPSDGATDFGAVARKIVGLRVFADEDGKMNRSLREVGGEILAVSQFTLFADTQKGRRPSFAGAARPEPAESWFNAFVAAIRCEGVRVETGRFGAMMKVDLTNDGPVTLWMELAEPHIEG